MGGFDANSGTHSDIHVGLLGIISMINSRIINMIATVTNMLNSKILDVLINMNSSKTSTNTAIET